MAGGWWLEVVTGLLYLRRRSSRAGKKKTVPSLPLLSADQAAEAGLQLGSVLSLSVFTAAAHYCVHGAATTASHCAGLSCLLSTAPSLATDNDEPSLEPALWSLVATPAAPNKFCAHAARHLGQVEQGTCYDSNIVLQL